RSLIFEATLPFMYTTGYRSGYSIESVMKSKTLKATVSPLSNGSILSYHIHEPPLLREKNKGVRGLGWLCYGDFHCSILQAGVLAGDRSRASAHAGDNTSARDRSNSGVRRAPAESATETVTIGRGPDRAGLVNRESRRFFIDSNST